MPMGVNWVGVPVSDQDKAIEFYTKVLGFELILDVAIPEDHEHHVPEARWIEVRVPEGNAHIALFTPPNQDHTIGTFQHMGFRTKDIHALYKDLSAKGVSFPMKPEKQVWGGIMAHFKDLDGNTFIVTQGSYDGKSE